jgi:ribonuclease PH
MRIDGRSPGDLRPIVIEKNVLKHAEGSALIRLGDTHVLCAATVEDSVPGFMKNSGKGWVTAEYGMLPRATTTRSTREATKGRQEGRTMEIQRLIGRSLRSVTDLGRFGERTIRLDCDVLQADGGTRVASITGAYVALVEAFRTLVRRNALSHIPVSQPVAAVSAGIVAGERLLDLCYEEDSRALVDLNVVMTGAGDLVEIQGTGEDRPFKREWLLELLDLSETGIRRLIEAQKQALGDS